MTATHDAQQIDPHLTVGEALWLAFDRATARYHGTTVEQATARRLELQAQGDRDRAADIWTDLDYVEAYLAHDRTLPRLEPGRAARIRASFRGVTP